MKSLKEAEIELGTAIPQLPFGTSCDILRTYAEEGVVYRKVKNLF